MQIFFLFPGVKNCLAELHILSWKIIYRTSKGTETMIHGSWHHLTQSCLNSNMISPRNAIISMDFAQINFQQRPQTLCLTFQSISLCTRHPNSSELSFSGHGVTKGHLYPSSSVWALPEKMVSEAITSAFTKKLDSPAQGFQPVRKQEGCEEERMQRTWRRDVKEKECKEHEERMWRRDVPGDFNSATKGMKLLWSTICWQRSHAARASLSTLLHSAFGSIILWRRIHLSNLHQESMPPSNFFWILYWVTTVRAKYVI